MPSVVNSCSVCALYGDLVMVLIAFFCIVNNFEMFFCEVQL